MLHCSSLLILHALQGYCVRIGLPTMISAPASFHVVSLVYFSIFLLDLLFLGLLSSISLPIFSLGLFSNGTLFKSTFLAPTECAAFNQLLHFSVHLLQTVKPFERMLVLAFLQRMLIRAH